MNRYAMHKRIIILVFISIVMPQNVYPRRKKRSTRSKSLPSQIQPSRSQIKEKIVPPVSELPPTFQEPFNKAVDLVLPQDEDVTPEPLIDTSSTSEQTEAEEYDNNLIENDSIQTLIKQDDTYTIIEDQDYDENSNVRNDPGSKNREIDQEPVNDDEQSADIYLNFENTELANFINYIAELRAINIIPHEKIGGTKISLTIRKALTKQGAWNIFLTIIEMAGFSIIKAGDVYKIIPRQQKLRQPLPAYINVSHHQLPATDENIRFVTFLQNINVRDVKDLFAGMLGTPNSVISQPNVNGLIITARAYDIKAAMKVIEQLDQTGLQESVTVMKLKHANATDVRDLFKSLIEKPTRSPLARLLGRQAESTTAYFSPTTKIIAEERTNSLILMGNAQSIKKIETFIFEHVDTQLKEIESPLHIYELQYADAQQVAEILEQVTSGGDLESEAGRQASRYGGVRGGVKYFKNMKFKVDKQGNRLIVSSTDKQDWRLLRKTIADLDKAQPQVAIETLIVTVNVEDTKQIGAQMRNRKSGMLGKSINIQTANLTSPVAKLDDLGNPVSLLGSMLSAFTAELGSTILTFGRSVTNGVWGALKILKQETNTSVISQPFITVANRAQGMVNVGETRRIATQRAVGTEGTIRQDSASGFKSEKVGTTIMVTPQINMDGIINFAIEIKISEFRNPEGDTQTRRVKTGATIADGQVLVLGGFVRNKITEARSRTPLLSSIPILGWLFKSKKRIIQKDYIFVFMCPTILKPRLKPGINLYTKMKLHQATDDVEDTIKTERANDPIHNWFFNPKNTTYGHKVVDFANARYQPTTVDIANDPYYRTHTKQIQKTNDVQDVEKKKEIMSMPPRSEQENQVDQEELATELSNPETTPKEDAEEIFADDTTEKIVSQSESIKENNLDALIAQRREEFKQLIADQPTQIEDHNSSDNHQEHINALKNVLAPPENNSDNDADTTAQGKIS